MRTASKYWCLMYDEKLHIFIGDAETLVLLCVKWRGSVTVNFFEMV
jgi:hypothetical protein